MKKIFSFFIFLLLSTQCFGATYYVDYDTGSDSNNGASTSTPWQHCPGDSNASGNADITLSAGDVVVFKGNIEYLGTINIHGGTADSEAGRITYDGDSGTYVSRWASGNEKAIINCENTRYYSFVGSGDDYFLINNFEIKNYRNGNNEGERYVIIDDVGQNYTYSGGLGSMQGTIDLSSCDYARITNCSIHTAQHWNHLCATAAEASAAGEPWSDGVPSQMRAIDAGSCNYLYIDSNEFYELGRDAVAFVGCTYVYLTNNNIGGESSRENKGYFSVGIRVNGGHHLYFQGNTIHDGWQYGGDESTGARCHGNDWTHVYGTFHDMYVERNFYYNDKDFSSTGNGRGSGQYYASDASYNIFIRNNVFAQPHAIDGCIIINTGCYGIRIENNTFIRWPTADWDGNIIRIGSSTPLSTSNNDSIKNNIVIDYESSTNSNAFNSSSSVGSGVINNNLWYLINKNASTDAFRVGGVSRTWNEFQSDGHDPDGQFGNPNLSSLPDNASNASSGDYSLTSGSLLAIDLGETLSGFAEDKNQVARPVGDYWDIGAYEYDSDTTPPAIEGITINDVTISQDYQ